MSTTQELTRKIAALLHRRAGGDPDHHPAAEHYEAAAEVVAIITPTLTRLGETESLARLVVSLFTEHGTREGLPIMRSTWVPAGMVANWRVRTRRRP